MQCFAQRRPVRALLPDRFIEQDDTADELAQPRRREEKFAVSPAVLLRTNGADGFEPLLDRAGALVSGKNSSSPCDERLGR